MLLKKCRPNTDVFWLSQPYIACQQQHLTSEFPITEQLASPKVKVLAFSASCLSSAFTNYGPPDSNPYSLPSSPAQDRLHILYSNWIARVERL